MTHIQAFNLFQAQKQARTVSQKDDSDLYKKAEDLLENPRRLCYVFLSGACQKITDNSSICHRQIVSLSTGSQRPSGRTACTTV